MPVEGRQQCRLWFRMSIQCTCSPFKTLLSEANNNRAYVDSLILHPLYWDLGNGKTLKSASSNTILTGLGKWHIFQETTVWMCTGFQSHGNFSSSTSLAASLTRMLLDCTTTWFRVVWGPEVTASSTFTIMPGGTERKTSSVKEGLPMGSSQVFGANWQRSIEIMDTSFLGLWTNPIIVRALSLSHYSQALINQLSGY